MERKHSLVPLGHFTPDLTEAELRGLAQRHDVDFEVRPHQIAQGGEIRRRGWIVELQGHASAADEALAKEEAHLHVHDVLHALARAALPTQDSGPVDVDLERYTGSVYLEPREGYREYIRLRIFVEPETAARMSLVAGTTDSFKDDICARLRSLGARPK